MRKISETWPVVLDGVARAFLGGLLTVLVVFGMAGLGCGVVLGSVPVLWVEEHAWVGWFLRLACS